MAEHDWLATRFEEHRDHLRAVAYRMLGSSNEAEDAVQDAWLRASRAGTDDVNNLRGWLTTVVARICLDMLRSRESRREESLDAEDGEPASGRHRSSSNPEQEAALADSVGLALLVVLDKLAPAERIAFVLHDMFDVPFEDIAPMVGRTATATRQLASRARRRVKGEPRVSGAELAAQRAAVDVFLRALREGDLDTLLSVLDPDLVVSADASVSARGKQGSEAPRDLRGARTWASQAVAFGRSMRFAHSAMIDGAVGIVMAPGGKLFRVLRFTFAGEKIARIEIVGDRAVLDAMELRVL